MTGTSLIVASGAGAGTGMAWVSAICRSINSRRSWARFIASFSDCNWMLAF